MENKIKYEYSFIGGVVYLVPIVINYFLASWSFVALLQWAFPIFLLGTIHSFAILYILNRLPTKRFRIIASVIFVLGLPFVFLGFIAGGLLGVWGIALLSSIPLISVLLAVWFMFYKEAKVKIRVIIVVVLFLLIGYLLNIARENAQQDLEARISEDLNNSLIEENIIQN